MAINARNRYRDSEVFFLVVCPTTGQAFVSTDIICLINQTTVGLTQPIGQIEAKEVWLEKDFFYLVSK